MTEAASLPDIIGDRRAPLCQAMTAALLERLQIHPAPKTLVAKCEQDFGHHLDYLATALAEDSPDLFAGYILWLNEVLAGLNVSPSCLPACLGILDGTLLQLLPKPLGMRSHRTIELALHRLAERLLGQPLPFEHLCPPAPENDEFTWRLLEGDFAGASARISDRMLHGQRYVDVAVDTIQPGMYRVGQLWQRGEITVAKEHLATATCHRAMAAATLGATPAPSNGRRALFACTPGSAHGLGLLMVSDAFDLAGWQSHYLGADTPMNAIVAQAEDTGADLLGLSVSVPTEIPRLRHVIAAVRGDLAGKAPEILVGGVALNWNPTLANTLKASWFPDARAAVEACTPGA